jgi:hypothetical protein
MQGPGEGLEKGLEKAFVKKIMFCGLRRGFGNGSRIWLIDWIRSRCTCRSSIFHRMPLAKTALSQIADLSSKDQGRPQKIACC